MTKCEFCEGAIDDGIHHQTHSECIRVITDRINSIFAKLQGTINPQRQEQWPKD